MKRAWLCYSCAQLFKEHWEVKEISVPVKLNGQPMDKRGCEQCGRNKRHTEYYEIGEKK